MKKSIYYFLLALLPFMAGCTRGIGKTAKDNSAPEVKNIILLIGDGMGVTQVYAAVSSSKQPLNFQMMPYSGFSITRSLSSYITDSAAGATALSTGKKTKNGVISQDTLNNDYKTILEIAEDHGLETGLVATSAITHATPAAFASHVPDRNQFENIASDILHSGVDVFIGGGYKYFAEREDKQNLIDSLKNSDYQIVKSLDELKSVTGGKLAGLLSEDHMPSVLSGRGEMLPEATAKAIELLSSADKGFFLMVEGSQIDWGGHNNDKDYVLTETLDFDKAIGKALEFAKADGHTLVVVTADHETGGLSLTGGNMKDRSIVTKFSTGGHTAVMVPVFSYGPGAEKFSGIMENTDIFEKMLELYSFED